MKKIVSLPLLLLALLFIKACDTASEKEVEASISPVQSLEATDVVLSRLAGNPQKIVVSAKDSSVVTGKKGTIIHINPDALETEDGSPMAETIEVDLVEMTAQTELVLNNAQTVSDGRILESGGAYYVKMSSNGHKLRLKAGRSIEAEFPVIVKEDMKLFKGQKDSLGEMNWKEIGIFEPKEKVAVTPPTKPKKQHVKSLYVPPSNPSFGDVKRIRYDDTLKLDDMNGGMIVIDLGGGQGINRRAKVSFDSSKTNDETYQKQYAEYEKRYAKYLEKQKQVAYQQKTYKAIKLNKLGWINCDRFIHDNAPKTDIIVKVKNDTLTGARFYVIFDDINSVMSTPYWKSPSRHCRFSGLPVGMNLKLVGLSAIDSIPYYYETNINTSTDTVVVASFAPDLFLKLKES